MLTGTVVLQSQLHMYSIPFFSVILVEMLKCLLILRKTSSRPLLPTYCLSNPLSMEEVLCFLKACVGEPRKVAFSKEQGTVSVSTGFFFTHFLLSAESFKLFLLI